ncbi:MAG: gluconate 2-dehydrogenase subunit 3 family protein [Saprospiraceae bacterium]|nr:gluconate 2-dehydrogenase subunit 3 family protein [Saprospiraceae bacterium]
MNRREIIKYTALVTGASLSAPLLSSLLVGCKNEVTTASSSTLKYFNDKEFEIVTTIVDLILPNTDSPSGSEVGVHHMIDHMLATVYDDDEKNKYDGPFQNMAVHLATLDFFNQNESNQTNILSDVLAYEESGLSDVKKGLNSLRQQSIAYYLSNEEIATKFLNYLPVPQVWEPCTPVSELEGKAWAI